MSVVAARGWQTQVFLSYGEIRESNVTLRAPRLRTASVLMTVLGRGFRAGERSAREADLLRLALASGRHVLSDELRRSLVDDASFDPMLGIYAGHSEVAQRRPDHEWIRRLLARLREILPDHPDVEALALYRQGDPGLVCPVLTDPPMLRSSWRLIAAASRRRPGLVEPGSPLDGVAEHVLASGPWLLSRLPEGDPLVHAAQIPPLFQASSKLEVSELMRRLRRLSSSGTGNLSPFQENLFQTLHTISAQHGGSLPKPSQLTSELSRRLDVPMGSVKRVVAGLEAALREIDGSEG
jgi:hypothetical protein